MRFRLKYFASGVLLLLLSAIFLILAIQYDVGGNNLIIWSLFIFSLVTSLVFIIFSFLFDDNKFIRWSFYLFVTEMVIYLLISMFDSAKIFKLIDLGGYSTFYIPSGLFLLSSACAGVFSIIGLFSAIFKK